MASSPTSTIGRRGTTVRTPSDPPIRPGGVCALGGCDRPLPPLAVLHKDPFHSARCCRTFYGLSESFIAPLGYGRSETHGTWRYRKHGCRCDVCREAMRDEGRRRREDPEYRERQAKRRRERYNTDPEYARKRIETTLKSRKKRKGEAAC